MRRREFITLLGGAAATWPVIGLAEQKTSRLGYFSPSRLNPELYKVLIDALRDLGWVEGRNLAIERRFAEDHLDRLPSLAAELVGLNLDVQPGHWLRSQLSAPRLRYR